MPVPSPNLNLNRNEQAIKAAIHDIEQVVDVRMMHELKGSVVAVYNYAITQLSMAGKTDKPYYMQFVQKREYFEGIEKLAMNFQHADHYLTQGMTPPPILYGAPSPACPASSAYQMFADFMQPQAQHPYRP